MKLKGLDKFIKALDNVEKVVVKEVKEVVQDNALWMEGQAKALAPVDSGHLRRNITTDDKSTDDKIEFEVHTGTVEYAEFVETGTSTQDAQPYFNPSYQVAERLLKQDLDKVMKKGMK